MGIKLPRLNAIKTGTGGVIAFGGLNRNLRRKENEFPSMRNMTSENLPVASVRSKRRYLRTLNTPNGLFSGDKLCWVDGTDFYADGVLSGQVTDGKKTFVRMGAQVLIWPDKLRYNSENSVMDALENHYTSAAAVSCTLCKADGTAYGEYTVASVAPESQTSGQLWMDTSGEKDVLRQYDPNTSMWTSIPTVYTMIACSGIGVGFSQYDGVTISGLTSAGLNGEFFLVSRTDDQIVVTALIREAFTQTAAVTVARTVPEMDYVCECNNRLWGCAKDGHEVYACALGDPTNWRQYMGLSTDSYAASLGSAGTFTGVAAHLGYVYFFKEDCAHQLMGTKPSNFTLSVLQARGVGEGNAASLIRANETLYYKSASDVCAFGSTMPIAISDSLPGIGGNAVGGVTGSRYYLCVDTPEGGRELLCYDVRVGAWVREDEMDVQWFAAFDGRLYSLTGAGELWCMSAGENPYDGVDARDEAAVEWMLETGDIGLDEAYNKYISGIQLHGDADLGTTICADVRYDMQGGWQEVFRGSPVTRRSMVIPIVPKRCHSLRLRLHGSGGMRLYSLVMRTEAGSDIYAAK